jgi:Thoeris protein ThsB, TIR-like domain
MMFRSTREDTLVRTIEARYGMDLNARGDTKLGNLLDNRGFDSLTQLVKAYRRELTRHACKRRVYLSFHVEDLSQVRGFRLMARAPNLEMDFYDGSLRDVIKSTRGAYIRQEIRAIIQRASVVVCLIGNGTAWREWVEWELNTALELGRGICGIRLKDSRGQAPRLFRDISAPVARWGKIEDYIAVIECAAARRS